MNKLTKILLFLEIILGFGFIVCLWAVGLIFAVFQFFFSVIAYGNLQDLMYMLFALSGGIGLWGFIQVAIIVFSPSYRSISKPIVILLSLVSGVSGIIYFTWPITSIGIKAVLFILPIVVTLHFLYLARAYFAPKNS